ncbi:MAG: hypothetical protein KAR79_05730 [Simkaniaceae bacterium]|nr:hypothetical protein [Simkaniaceae bacterium]
MVSPLKRTFSTCSLDRVPPAPIKIKKSPGIPVLKRTHSFYSLDRVLPAPIKIKKSPGISEESLKKLLEILRKDTEWKRRLPGHPRSIEYV